MFSRRSFRCGAVGPPNPNCGYVLKPSHILQPGSNLPGHPAGVLDLGGGVKMMGMKEFCTACANRENSVDSVSETFISNGFI